MHGTVLQVLMLLAKASLDTRQAKTTLNCIAAMRALREGPRQEDGGTDKPKAASAGDGHQRCPAVPLAAGM